MNVKPLLLIFCHLFQANIDRSQSFPPGWKLSTGLHSVTATSPGGWRILAESELTPETLHYLRVEAWMAEDEIRTYPRIIPRGLDMSIPTNYAKVCAWPESRRNDFPRPSIVRGW